MFCRPLDRFITIFFFHLMLTCLPFGILPFRFSFSACSLLLLFFFGVRCFGFLHLCLYYCRPSLLAYGCCCFMGTPVSPADRNCCSLSFFLVLLFLVVLLYTTASGVSVSCFAFLVYFLHSRSLLIVFLSTRVILFICYIFTSYPPVGAFPAWPVPCFVDLALCLNGL